jgi:hypothetical protein
MAETAKEDDESGVERGRFQEPIDRAEIKKTDHRELSRAECMAQIGFEIATRGYARTELGKQDLNSVYWSLTGGEFAPWIDFGTERSPDLVDLREGVAEAAGFKYGRFESHADCEGLCWMAESETMKYTRGVRARKFRLPELRAIVYELRSSEDKRSR